MDSQSAAALQAVVLAGFRAEEFAMVRSSCCFSWAWVVLDPFFADRVLGPFTCPAVACPSFLQMAWVEDKSLCRSGQFWTVQAVMP